MIYVVALGRLGRDPEVKSVGGKQVVKFSIASDTGSGENKRTSWLNCSAWEKRGEFVAKYFRKGDSILVRGNLTSREYDGKTYWELEVDKADFTGAKKSEAQDRDDTGAPPAGYGDDDTSLPFDL